MPDLFFIFGLGRKIFSRFYGNLRNFGKSPGFGMFFVTQFLTPENDSFSLGILILAKSPGSGFFVG